MINRDFVKDFKEATERHNALFFNTKIQIIEYFLNECPCNSRMTSGTPSESTQR